MKLKEWRLQSSGCMVTGSPESRWHARGCPGCVLTVRVSHFPDFSQTSAELVNSLSIWSSRERSPNHEHSAPTVCS